MHYPGVGQPVCPSSSTPVPTILPLLLLRFWFFPSHLGEPQAEVVGPLRLLGRSPSWDCSIGHAPSCSSCLGRCCCCRRRRILDCWGCCWGRAWTSHCCRSPCWDCGLSSWEWRTCRRRFLPGPDSSWCRWLRLRIELVGIASSWQIDSDPDRLLLLLLRKNSGNSNSSQNTQLFYDC